jgi:hypothetical protein
MLPACYFIFQGFQIKFDRLFWRTEKGRRRRNKKDYEREIYSKKEGSALRYGSKLF